MATLSVSDQIVLSDALQYTLKLKDPTQAFAETLTQRDAYRLVMAGSATISIEIGETLVMSDAFFNPATRVTQSPIEIVFLASDAKVRVTQVPIEVVYAATANARLTQVVVEVIAQKPAASLVVAEIRMIIN